MKIRVSGRARVRIRKQDEWWRVHRQDAPDLFKQELEIAFARMLRGPKVRKPYREIDGEPVCGC